MNMTDVIMLNIAGRQQIWTSVDKPVYTVKELLATYGEHIHEVLNLKELPTLENFEQNLYVL
jgi:hypothetical protein